MVKIFKFAFIVIFIFGWFYNYPPIRFGGQGWPKIWQNPPAPLNRYLSGPLPQETQKAWAANTVIFIISTASTTWTVPSDWNNSSNTIEVIGGGGGGSGTNSDTGSAGGGGGAYSKAANVSLTAGGMVTIAVGAAGLGGVAAGGTGGTGGDTYVCNATSNCTAITGTAVVAGAKGGGGGTVAGVVGSGGATANGTGTTKFAGGNGGGTATIDLGGGGGGGAGGLNAAGNNGVTPTTATGANGGQGDGTFGGAGGIGSTAPTTGGAGIAGTEWNISNGSGGGGGGGGYADAGGAVGAAGGNYGGGGGGGGTDGQSGKAGGAGVQGLIVITYTPAASGTVSCSTNITTSTFGTLGVGSISTASPNASTTFSCTFSLGCTLSISDTGLATSSPAYTIASTTGTLAAGTEGWGIQAATTTAGSGATLTLNSTYNVGGNTVGGLQTTAKQLASSTTTFSNREVVVTHKAAISASTQAGKYADTITYTCVGN